jgi:aerobic-type carbon monoxide dehydrogenase small subunit (CoxS/CutS family)
MEETIRFELNGKKIETLLDTKMTLLWVLRNKLGLTGTISAGHHKGYGR